MKAAASLLPTDALQSTRHPFRYLARHWRPLLTGLFCLLLTNALAQSIPWVIKHAVDLLRKGDGRISFFVAIIAGMAIAQGVIRILSRIFIFNAGREAEYELRGLLFTRLCQLDGAFYRKFRTGDLISRLTNDLSSVRTLFGAGVLNSGNTIFAYIVALPLMFQIDPWLTVIALSPYPLLFLGAKTFSRGIYQRSHALQKALACMSSAAEENLAGIREVKVHHLEEQRADLFDRSSAQYLTDALGLARWRGAFLPVVGLGSGLSLILVLWIGGTKVISGRMTLGGLVAFTLYIGLLAWPTVSMGWLLSLWQRGLAAWQRLEEILVERSALEVELLPGGSASPSPFSSPARDLELRDLSLRINETPVLRGITLRVPAGSLYAIVGRVGSGKTTLLQVIARLINVPSGTLFLDGRDATTLEVSQVRRQMAYAPQEAFLFSATIRENIAYGLFERHTMDPREEAGRIDEVIRTAGLERDLRALPEGLDTLVGERGITLSGGQRQRVALARALISVRPILLLDDSLSSVDAETEKTILEELRRSLAGRTALLVSHRLYAMELADRVVVLDKGEIVESGRHLDLITQQGLYSELYRRQLLSGAWSR